MRFARSTRFGTRSVALAAALGLVLAACGAESESEPEAASGDTDASAEDGDRLTIVATTSILGDIVGQLVGDDADVTVLMPPGADPHAYEPSAQDGAMLREADLVVTNGLMLEENLVSALETVEDEGGNVFELADQLDPIDFDWDGPDDHGHGHDDEDDHGHDDDDDHGHGDEDDHGHGDDDDHGHGDDDDHGHGDDDDHAHGDDDDHGHGDDDDHGHGDEDDHGHSHAEDPHVWFDPIRMADGVAMIAAEIAAVDTTLDADEWDARAETYVDELMDVHEEMEAMFATIDDEDRVLVTNHDALGYLAVRYEFEVLGTVIPGSSTQADADPRGFSELIATVEEAGVPAVFAENTDSTVLAEQLASEVIGRGDLEVEVVRIYTDALGEEGSGAETYLGLLRTTAELITDALT
jgi:zinc/manganese transport system substrate-binding protein